MKSLRDMIGGLMERARRADRLHRDRRHLARLDDRLLEDIGMTRQEIDLLLARGGSARGARPPRLDRGAHAARLQ